MKGKLVQMGSTLGPNNLALGGLGFIIVYLSTKWVLYVHIYFYFFRISFKDRKIY